MTSSIKIQKQFKNHKINSSLRGLIKLAGIIPKGSGLPKDLSANHDRYLWEESCHSERSEESHKED